MLVRLAEEAANLVCGDDAVLTLAHPALVLVLLREAVPEDLKSLPYGLLAHCSDQRGNTIHFKRNSFAEPAWIFRFSVQDLSLSHTHTLFQLLHT